MFLVCLVCNTLTFLSFLPSCLSLSASDCSEGHTEDFLALFNSSSDGRRKLASLSKTSKDHTTWNILVTSNSSSGVVVVGSYYTCKLYVGHHDFRLICPFDCYAMKNNLNL